MTVSVVVILSNIEDFSIWEQWSQSTARCGAVAPPWLTVLSQPCFALFGISKVGMILRAKGIFTHVLMMCSATCRRCKSERSSQPG